MEVVSWIIGLTLVGLGFLVKASPDLIAGYNTMTAEQKSNVDINGLSSYMKKGFIAIGLFIIVQYYLFSAVGLDLLANSMLAVCPFVGIAILIIKARKFDKNKTGKKTTVTYILLGTAALFVVGLFYSGSKPVEVIVNSQSLIVKGMYGFELPIGTIREVKLVENIPTITLRTNGYSSGTTKKGYFNLEEFGNCRLFLCSDFSPYLIITEDNGSRTIINFEERKSTETAYKQLKRLTTSNQLSRTCCP